MSSLIKVLSSGDEMEVIRDNVLGTRHTINYEYDRARGADFGERAPDLTDESLDRIEETLNELRSTIREGAFFITLDNRFRIRKFSEELDQLEKMVRDQKMDLERNGLRGRYEDILCDVRNIYNSMVNNLMEQ